MIGFLEKIFPSANPYLLIVSVIVISASFYVLYKDPFRKK